MKNYVVIYNTASIDNCQYAFGASSLDEAIEKAPNLVSGEIVGVFETDDLGHPFIEKYNDVKKALHSTEQNYKTKEGWVIVDGQKVFVHKHWSDDSAGYPCWGREDIQGGRIGTVVNEKGKAVFNRYADFTAVYDTSEEKNVKHVFKSADFETALSYCKANIEFELKRLTGRWAHMKEERIYICENLSDFVNKYNKADFMLYYYDSQKTAMDEKLIQALKKEKLENPFDTVLELKDHLFELSTQISQNETN